MKTILLIILMTLFSVNSFAGDFRKWDWGMAIPENDTLFMGSLSFFQNMDFVEKLIQNDTSYTFFDGKIAEFDSSIAVYSSYTSIVDLDALVTIEFFMYDGIYVKKMISKKYGEGKQYGVYSANWDTPNTKIAMHLDDMSKIKIRYISKQYNHLYKLYTNSVKKDKADKKKRRDEDYNKKIDDDF